MNDAALRWKEALLDASDFAHLFFFLKVGNGIEQKMEVAGFS